jgi:hypothetical protein
VEWLLLINTIMFLFLFCIWKSNDILNLAIRMACFGLLVGNLIATLAAFGVIMAGG